MTKPKGNYVHVKCPHCGRLIKQYLELVENKEEKPAQEDSDYPAISDLMLGQEDVTLKAIVKSIKNVSKTDWTLRMFVLTDGMSDINLPVFGDLIERTDEIQEGDTVIVSCWKTEMYKDHLQLVAGKGLKMTKV